MIFFFFFFYWEWSDCEFSSARVYVPDLKSYLILIELTNRSQQQQQQRHDYTVL